MHEEGDNAISNAHWIEYPSDARLLQGLQPDTVYSYVSSTYLEGFINYVEPVKLVLLERYDILEDHEFEHKVAKLVEAPHSRLGSLGDDVLVLAKEGETAGWLFFWFDCDTSDCCVGRFGGGLNQTEAVGEFMKFVEALPVKDFERMRAEKRDAKAANPDIGYECVTGFRELPLEAWRGWVSFI